jgi:hypothetical protein
MHTVLLHTISQSSANSNRLGRTDSNLRVVTNSRNSLASFTRDTGVPASGITSCALSLLVVLFFCIAAVARNDGANGKSFSTSCCGVRTSCRALVTTAHDATASAGSPNASGITLPLLLVSTILLGCQGIRLWRRWQRGLLLLLHRAVCNCCCSRERSILRTRCQCSYRTSWHTIADSRTHTHTHTHTHTQLYHQWVLQHQKVHCSAYVENCIRYGTRKQCLLSSPLSIEPKINTTTLRINGMFYTATHTSILGDVQSQLSELPRRQQVAHTRMKIQPGLVPTPNIHCTKPCIS